MKKFLIYQITSALIVCAIASAQSFYKEPPLFSTAPDPAKSVNVIERFGPVGIALELHQPAFAMVISAVEPGSPAAMAGLKKGQSIETLNGEVLKDIDPRIQLGNILARAEASDGVFTMMIKEDTTSVAKEVIVTIPVLGNYSATWPMDCPKSEKIIRQFADQLTKPGANQGFANAGMLFLLSTGEERDLAPVKAWVHQLAEKKSSTGYAWHIGFGGIPLCEYYLRTGDPVALPVIQQWVNIAAKGEYLDAWAGRGGVVRLNYGNGHLNAGGTAVVTFLMLAKQCGVDINDSLLHRTLTHFFRYAGRGINPYGDDRPETSFVDNGKHGNLAFAMAAAASLTPEGEKSIYAKARDVCASTSFYTTTYMLHGHTGGGIGEIWRSGSMALMHQKKPFQYREFMDHRKWHYDLSRRFTGAFGILGGAAYDTEEWGACYPWAYTFPRKTLRITGAPPSSFSKLYQLPTRPWGTAADDEFLTAEPVTYTAGKRSDISGETLAKDSSRPLITRLSQKELSEDEIRQYISHPEYLIRNMIANHAAGLSCDYMSPKPGQRLRPELLEEFCKHPDPRVRNAGFRAGLKAFQAEAAWCRNIYNLAIARLQDDAESWFVKDACLAIIAAGTADMIVPHIDLILIYLKHQEQWLQNGALVALSKVIVDERCFEKVLPAVGETLRSTQRQSTTNGPLYALRQQLPNASLKVRDLALKVLGDAYANYSGKTTWEGGQNLTGHRNETLEVLASALSEVPGGFDVLYSVAQKLYPDDPLPHDQIFLAANPEKFGASLQKVILPLIREELIYQYIGQNRGVIQRDLLMTTQNGTVTNSLDGLVALYQKIGIHDYDWKNFGPDLKTTAWNYHSFDPKEEQKFDQSPWRYRPVTAPNRMEQWFAKDFEAAKAGWKSGLPPFGQFKGKLISNAESGRNSNQEIPLTFWEKEVLLIQGVFDFPALKPDHIYRIRADRGQGVGTGDGYKIYINGKALVETKAGLGRREGDTIRGGWISPEFVPEFAKGPVTIGAMTFLRYGDRAIVQMPPIPQGIFSIWLEERKLPTLDETVMRKAASFVPMVSSKWQELQDPLSPAEDPEEGKYQFDGGLTANDKVLGRWKVISQVKTIDEFLPAAKHTAGKAPFSTINFHDSGSTDDQRWIWSGDMLMDLDTNSANKIIGKSIDGKDYLFIESGGFSSKNPSAWKSPLLVLCK